MRGGPVEGPCERSPASVRQEAQNVHQRSKIGTQCCPSATPQRQRLPQVDLKEALAGQLPAGPAGDQAVAHEPPPNRLGAQLTALLAGGSKRRPSLPWRPDQALLKIGDSAYVAYGWDLTSQMMVVGDDGVIIIGIAIARTGGLSLLLVSIERGFACPYGTARHAGGRRGSSRFLFSAW
jgi:hypothetical protein